MLYGTEEYGEQYIREDCNEKYIELGADLENLHISRADNPYLSCEALTDVDDTSLSPTPGSPRPEEVSPQTVSPQEIMEVHSRLVRSPPPVYWPNKVFEFSDRSWTSPLSPSNRSDRAFSPESGSDGMETERSYHSSYGTRSQSEERIISPCADLLSPGVISPVRGQTPVYSPMRGQTPEITDFSPPPDRSRQHSTPDGARVLVSPRSMSQSYHRSISQTSQQRLRSRTPDEEFSPSRFNIYTLHHKSMRNKSESSYLVTSPGRDLITHYQPASRRSLANLGSRTTRKSSTDFLSWLPRRSRSRTRSDAKSMENLQSSNANVRPLDYSTRMSHKSLSSVGDDAGLLIQEGAERSGGGTATSPRPRRRFSGIRKSLSLKQKKCNQGPLYVDIDTQDL